MFANLSPNMKAAIFTAIFTGAGAIGTGLYNIGYSNGARDIADLQSFKEGIPKLREYLDRVSASLVTTTQMIDENKKLAKDVSELKAENKALKDEVSKDTADLSDKNRRLGELSAEIAKAFPEDEIKISIAKGSTERVLGNLLTIGVLDVYTITKSVTAKINGEEIRFAPGDSKIVKVADRTCTIYLAKVEDPAPMVVSCSKKEKS